jgi:hypothetical protein
MFLGQALNYGLVAAGFIVIADKWSEAAFVLDVFTYIVGFVILKRLLEAKSWSLVWAAAFGGASGTVIAIELSRVIFR